MPDKVVIDGLEFLNIRVCEISFEQQNDEKESESEKESETESESEENVKAREVEPEFVHHQVEGGNSKYEGKKLGRVMSLNENDYNNCEKVDL